MTDQIQEGPWELVTSRSTTGWQGVALDDVDESTLVPVQVVVLAANGAHLERVAVQLPSFLEKMNYRLVNLCVEDKFYAISKEFFLSILKIFQLFQHSCLCE